MRSIKVRLYFILSAIFILNVAMKCEGWDDIEPPTVDISRVDIANVDNAGEKPFISSEPIKKEAYMLGVKYIGDTDDEVSYYAFKENVRSEKIFCNTDFDAEHPAGSDVTRFFKKTSYTPQGLDYAFLLRKVPQAGTYSFKIVSQISECKIFEASTEPVELY